MSVQCRVRPLCVRMLLATVAGFASIAASLSVDAATPAGGGGRQPAPATFIAVVVGDDGTPLEGVHVKIERVPPAPGPTAPSALASGARPLGWLPPLGSDETAGTAEEQPSGGSAGGADTDSSGRVRLEAVAAGLYRVMVAEPPGLVLSSRVRTVDLLAGQSTSIVVHLERGGSVTGRVLVNGKGVPGVNVRVLGWSGAVGGPRRLIAVSAAGPSWNVTRPNGEFGFYGLPAGEYYILATGYERQAFADVSSTGPVPTYYPGVTALHGARPVTIRPGEVTARTDFSLVRAKRSAVHVTAFDSHRQRLPFPPFARVEMRPASDAHAVQFTTASTAFGAWRGREGEFLFPNVPAGDYDMVASLYTDQDPGENKAPASRVNGQPLWEIESSHLPVTVTEGENQKLEIRTNTGATVSGHVVFEGRGSSAPGPAGGPVVTTRAAGFVQLGPPVTARVQADGAFELRGLRGMLTMVAQSRGITKSVTIGGRDVTGQALEFNGTERLTDVVITVTSETARLNGSVIDSSADAVLVIAFPDDAARCGPGSQWIRLVRVQTDVRQTTAPGRDADGRPSPLAARAGSTSFAMGFMLPGRYFVAAVPERAWTPVWDAQTFEKLKPSATPIVLKAGDVGNIELRMAR